MIGLFRKPPVIQKARGMEGVIDRLAPKMQRAVQLAARAAQRRIDLAALSAALAMGRVSQAVRQLDLDRFTASDLATVAQVLFEAQKAGQKIGTVKKGVADTIGWALDVTNELARKAAEVQAARLLTAENLQVKQTVRGLIERAYREQIPVPETARLIRDVIGLNDRQATALFNYRAGLVEEEVDPTRMARMTERYGDRLLRDRALTIAQTEVHRASAEGQHDLWREGVRTGYINPAVARRYWIANAGACAWCEGVESLNAEGVLVDGQFDTPSGSSIDGPEDSHVSCRCSTRIDLEG